MGCLVMGFLVMGPLGMRSCVMGHFMMGRFVMGRFVCESILVFSDSDSVPNVRIRSVRIRSTGGLYSQTEFYLSKYIHHGYWGLKKVTLHGISKRLLKFHYTAQKVENLCGCRLSC
jgi:hypothetical protein